jgi:L-glutamine-phosphate cytidylyltransferase
MKLIILAAGFGGRLSSETELTPKALLKITEENSIMDYQLQAANACGIDEVHVVTGFESEQIENKLKKYQSKFKILDWFYNPFFRVTNNLVSLWCARPIMEDDFIFLNGDDVFNSNVLQRLLDDNGEFVAVTSNKSHYDSDDTKILLDGGYVAKIGKDLEPETADGEWIGMCKVSGQSRLQFRNILDCSIRDGSLREPEGTYLPFLQACINSELKIKSMPVDSSDWAEVDFQSDLEYVRKNISSIVG